MLIFHTRFHVHLQHAKEHYLLWMLSQGVEAQTISNLYLAIENGLDIIPVMNKIDLPESMAEEVTDQVLNLIGGKEEDIILASAKADIGTEDILEAIVKRIPSGKR